MMKSKIFNINNYPWGRPEICPVSFAEIQLCDDGISVHLIAEEQYIKATVIEDNGPVCKDSCLEFFFCPCPEISKAYFNFEINPLGTLYIGFSDTGSRKDSKPVNFSDQKDLFCINVVKEDTHWEASYKIPFDFIKKYLSDFNGFKCKYIKGNFYKCGDETRYPHYAVWHDIDSNVVKKPDFHVVDFFGKIYF